MEPEPNPDLLEILAELCLLSDDIDGYLAAMPIWKQNKALHQILSAAGHLVPGTFCECHYYRDDTGIDTRCVCGHLYEWHEGLRRCWYRATPS
jgi:hypothetical protein